jgi:hypothetical protein
VNPRVADDRLELLAQKLLDGTASKADLSRGDALLRRRAKFTRVFWSAARELTALRDVLTHEEDSRRLRRKHRLP